MTEDKRIDAVMVDREATPNRFGMLMTKAAELFVSKLGTETVRVAQMQNRRKLLPEDVTQVCGLREPFAFLRDDLKDLVKAQKKSMAAAAAAAGKGGANDSKKAVAANSKEAINAKAAVGTMKLTSFFAKK